MSSRPGLVLLPLLLLTAPALAAELQPDTGPGDLDGSVLVESLPVPTASPSLVAALAYEAVGFDPGGEDRAPRGPEELALGPDGWLALADPVDREVIVLQDGARHAAFAVDRPTDLLFLEAAEGAWPELLVLDGPARTVQRWTVSGDLLESWPLPGLVPQGGHMHLDEEGRLAMVDLFGNRHAVGRVTPDGLLPPEGPRLEQAPEPLLWDAPSSTYSTPERSFALPGALVASGARHGDWLVLDVVTADAPITVERTALHLHTGTAAALPAAERTYVPHGDVAVDPLTGALVYLHPGPAGLRVLEVMP